LLYAKDSTLKSSETRSFLFRLAGREHVTSVDRTLQARRQINRDRAHSDDRIYAINLAAQLLTLALQFVLDHVEEVVRVVRHQFTLSLLAANVYADRRSTSTWHDV
jgi:hypothetical protein